MYIWMLMRQRQHCYWKRRWRCRVRGLHQVRYLFLISSSFRYSISETPWSVTFFNNLNNLTPCWRWFQTNLWHYLISSIHRCCIYSSALVYVMLCLPHTYIYIKLFYPVNIIYIIFSISTSVVYKDSCLMAGARRKHHTHTSSDELPTSHPSKWPGKYIVISSYLRGYPTFLCEGPHSNFIKPWWADCCHAWHMQQAKCNGWDWAQVSCVA